MTFACLACNNHLFTIDSVSVVNQQVPVITFACPVCRTYNAVSHRPGGGLVVSVDIHLTNVEAGRKPVAASTD
jgi:hypothetical protein